MQYTTCASCVYFVFRYSNCRCIARCSYNAKCAPVMHILNVRQSPLNYTAINLYSAGNALLSLHSPPTWFHSIRSTAISFSVQHLHQYYIDCMLAAYLGIVMLNMSKTLTTRNQCVFWACSVSVYTAAEFIFTARNVTHQSISKTLVACTVTVMCTMPIIENEQ